MQYIKELVELKTNGKGYSFKQSLGVNYIGLGDDLRNGQPEVAGFVETLDDIKNLNNLLYDDKVQHFQDVRYL